MARRATPRARPRRNARVRLRRRVPGLRHYGERARLRLRSFRQGSVLAVATTAFLLLVTGAEESTGQPPDAAAGAQPAVAVDPAASIEQATGTIQELLLGLYGVLPKLVLCLLVVALAAIAGRIAGAVLNRALGRWEKAAALGALTRIALYVAALAVSMSILSGDATALLGSVGLVGLALSWALQTPIESFTGWLLNSMQSYYRVGDRIEVGDVFGDVYKIDVLTTTVWEAGGPGKAVAGAQPTGAMITFPNWEVLRSNIVNYSRDFPFVWDEVTVAITNESDLSYAASVLEAVANEVAGEEMVSIARDYERLLSRARIAFDVDERPRVFFSLADAWTNCTVRYLVGARARRRLASDMVVALTRAVADPAHGPRLAGAYPRTEVRLRRAWQEDVR